ncbi:hypothetical protein ACFFLS_15250 [Flavobacterium procerum]|uniref:TonB C-terminal domain-containing protein n=1 Tax=Flavobacterium procerum TaxID=1455569 RepID=A0ABV6BSI7_9FLAO
MKKKHKINAPTKYYKSFLLILYTGFITVVFSCQNKEDKKQDAKSIEVAVDSTTKKSTVLEKTANNKKSDQTISATNKAEQIEFRKSTPIVSEKTAKEKVVKEKTSKPEKVEKEDAPKTTKPPSNLNAEFPGGIDQFHTFFMKEYKKPEGVYYWKLNFTLAFAVEKNGTVSFLECSPAVEEPLEKEIVRVLNLCPKWQPGESNGKKIRMQYSVPILLK